MSNTTADKQGAPGSPEGSLPDYHPDEKAPGAKLDGPVQPIDGPALPAPDGGYKSYGVQRVEALGSVTNKWDRFGIFFGVFLCAYAYGLDGTLRYAYQPTATNAFADHSLLSTISVLRAVIAAAAQPTAGKIADVFGRLELILVSIFFYVVGTIVETTSHNVSSFCAGAVIYQVGYTMIMVLLEVLIADLTSTRERLLFSYIPAAPFIINTWVSGNVSAAVLGTTTWQWGIGMWCIIFPVCSAPLLISLWIVGRRARRQGLLDGYKSPFQVLGFKGGMVDLFWRLDVPGIILLIAVFALILTPLTIAGGVDGSWNRPHIIAPIVVGVCCLPAFVFWQAKAPHPLIPFRLMKDRGVWGALGVALMLNFSWYMQGDYLYSIMLVSFDFDVMTATRVSSIYSFCSTITGFIIGFVVFKIRRLKIFIVVGTCLWLVAFGLLIHFRGGAHSSGRSGVIGAQVLLGIAGGMFPYTAQASLQVSLKHEHIAVMTGTYLAIYNVGSALGNSISGAIWTQVLPEQLADTLSSFNNETLVQYVYNQPLFAILDFPTGTAERDGIIDAYRHVQRLLCITGICLCVPLIAFGLCTRNPKLNDKQTLAHESDDDSVRRVE